MKLIIQKPSASDYRQIGHLHAAVFREIGETTKTAEEFLSGTKELHVRIAKNGKVVIGYAVVYCSRSTGYFSWLGVKKTARESGAGSMLLKTVENICRKAKVKTIILDSRNRFRKAISLYLKHDYKIVGTWIHEDGEIMVRLRKDLKR